MPERVDALDLIRGVAVLGILAINIAGFAGPPAASLSPHIPSPGSFADEVAFALGFLLFEGKMRALFAILFGASMVLFIERREASGQDGDRLQLQRLGWLMAFGYLHFLLFWWGDILFLYALCGIVALLMRHLPVKTLLAIALLLFAGWHGSGALLSQPDIAAEERVRLGTASPEDRRYIARYHDLVAADAQDALRESRSGFAAQALAKLNDRPFWLLEMTLISGAEIVPMMLIGMVLYRTGFFTGRWGRRRTARVAGAGFGLGLALTGAILAWIWPRDFPPVTMGAVLLYWTALPHLLMALSYAGLLVLWVNRLKPTPAGRRLSAAGRMAFSNYLGSTIVMTAIFYGWGLGLAGTVGHAGQWLFVLLGWALMLGWSAPWLARYRQGPLEWLWRSLVERRFLSNRL